LAWRSETNSPGAPPAPLAARLIDIPIESLPFVDEHRTTIATTADSVWEALVAVVAGSTSGRGGGAVARALGCAHAERSGQPGRIGSTLPGFVVTRSVRPSVLALMGEHRFSRYALIFTLDPTPSGPVVLSAQTRAQFPGPAGRAYRLLVIRSRGHVLVTKRLLRTVRRRAERA
jgi:hypothetical protein